MDIVNIVISGSLNQNVDLFDMSRKMINFDYNPELYHGGYLHLKKHLVTIYRTGKYIIPGLKSFLHLSTVYEELKQSLSSYVDVEIIGYPEIRNIVASNNLESAPNLVDLCLKLFNYGFSPDYEPETFPGLILKLDAGTINLFSSGKYILLGAKSEKGLITLDNQFLSILDSLQ